MTSSLLISIIVLLIFMLGAVAALMYFFARQQQRLVRRLALLEQQVKQSSAAYQASSTGAAARSWLPTDFLSLRFSDLNSEPVGLDAFAGRKVLLVNWNPRCGFCELIAPELAQLTTALGQQEVEIVFVCHDDRETNRELALRHGLQGRLLFPPDAAQASALFQGRGTPAAYLLEKDLRLAYPLTVGADAVLQLVRHAALGSKQARPAGEKLLAQSRIERQGLKLGTMAPSFSLPNVFGGTITLTDYRGKTTVLIFTDPGCRPCNELFPKVRRLHQERDEDVPAIILIGRGDPVENRRKLEEHGLAIPLVVQRNWELSRRYGIFAIPVAFLIDENGFIADRVARGPGEICKLIKENARATA